MSKLINEVENNLEGIKLYIAAILLALANFVVLLDMTIANVSISHIAGSLAISVNEGTYVITSYAVAEAISVPLTGWLAKRFGTVRTFITCFMLFGFFSFICGCANSLLMLVMGRVFQGFSGGPLMPLTQTLISKIFPAEKRSTGLALWSMTLLLAPIIGPIVGGAICDNWHWSFIFYINVPIVVACSFASIKLLTKFETRAIREKIDKVGLILLIVWVASLQIMLDEGKNYDWFASTRICALGVIAFIVFGCFLIWEITQNQPIVDLKVFRHKGYTASVITLSLTFGAYFSSVVLTPIWLQNYMNYTATWSGCTTASTGVFAIFIAPIAAKLSTKYDARYLVFLGVMWLCLITFIRSFCSTDFSYFYIALPLLIQGLGTPFFFIPLTTIAMSSVNDNEVASAAGLMNFLRTLSGAISTSIVTTTWDNYSNIFQTDLSEKVQITDEVASLTNDPSFLAHVIDQIMQVQLMTLSMNHIYFTVSIVLLIAAALVWIAPKAKGKFVSSGH